jgi:type IV secretion system protein VirB10
MYGVYSTSVTPGQKRQLVAMQRMILPNGASVSLAGATASDLLGQSGIAAEVDNHFFETFSSSFVLGAASLLLPNGQSTVSTSSNAAGSVTTGSVAGLALNESLRTLLERNRRIDRTLTTDSATPFLLVVARDMALPPYRK